MFEGMTMMMASIVAQLNCTVTAGDQIPTRISPFSLVYAPSRTEDFELNIRSKSAILYNIALFNCYSVSLYQAVYGITCRERGLHCKQSLARILGKKNMPTQRCYNNKLIAAWKSPRELYPLTGPALFC